MIAFLRVFGVVPGWVYALALSGAIASGLVAKHQRDTARSELAQVEAMHAKAEALRSEAARQAEAALREREQTHAQAIQAATQKAAHEKTRLAADLQRTIDSLRNRPQRPASAPGGAVPQSAAAPVGCTGAGIFREDGEFLAREAARADQLRLALGRCQAAYDAAVELTR